jgi:cytochrome c oxidase subunit II
MITASSPDTSEISKKFGSGTMMFNIKKGGNMTSQRRLILIVIIAAFVTCLLAAVILLLLWNSTMPGWMGMDSQAPRARWPNLLQRFETNGERIYFTSVSESGRPITSDIQGMHRMRSSRIACVDCHGADGRGGVVTMMMERFEAPDIRYSPLTSEEHGKEDEGNGHDEHPPYTDETIKRAITEGIDPAGEQLDRLMPRWRMDERDLDDLVEFLKTLE